MSTKKLFRMAERYRKTTGRGSRSPQMQLNPDCAKSIPNPEQLLVPPRVDEPEIIHLATEVPNDHGYDDELGHEQFLDQAYAPVMTEEHEIQGNQYAMDQINFTGKNRSDAVTKVTRRMTDRIVQKSQLKRQASFDSDFVDGDLLPPQSSRARSTSQYYHRLDEQSHQ